MDKKILVSLTKTGLTQSFSLDDYVACVVASEIGNAPIEACKAQAIAARTFAWEYVEKQKPISDQGAVAQAFRTDRMNKDLYPNAFIAAIETRSMVLTYGGVIIPTCSYSASNGGMTVSSEERWGGYRPWLITQKDPWDLAATGGKKNGHGVGMSQKGAIYAAGIGKSYEEILSFYYPGCIVKKVGGNIMENEKTAKIEAWALSKVGCPYVYGGTGKTCTVAYRQTQANQYPDSAAQIQKNCQRMSGNSSSCAGCKWYDDERHAGKPCYDCAQQTRWAMNEVGISFPSGATSQWRKADWAKKGTIDSLPDCLCVVYRQDNDGTMGHTGIYLGDGTVVDARGTNYGVLHETVEKYGRWTHWGIPAGQYDEIQEEAEEPIMTAVVTGGNLNLRSAKSKGSAAICRMPNGATVNILEKGEEWCKVSYNGKTGYAMSNYLLEQTSQAGEYDIVIHCSTAAERDRILEQFHGAVIK